VDADAKSCFHSIIFSILYVLLFVILIPPLIKVLDETWGKLLYGVLVAGAVIVAFRLRFLARHLR
jgi:hypothetical protein